MLTEGWDANTVTHVLGVRAFGTQLLCEQVVGRALRRQSYTLNAEDQFDVEYADVLGIPFDFAAKPVVVPPKPPVKTTRVHGPQPRARCAGNPLPARRWLSRRTAGRAPESHLQRELRPHPHARPGRPVHDAEPGHRGRGREPDGAAPGGHARQHDRLPPGQAPAVPQVPRPRRRPEAAPVRPAQGASRRNGCATT